MVSEVSRFPVPLDTGTRPLHGVSSTSSEFTGTATRRNRANVILLHRLPQARCLALKRRWPRHIVVRTEKALRTSVTNRGRRRRSPACRQAGSGRDNRQIPCHHSRSTDLLTRGRDTVDPARSEAARVHGRHRAEDVVVVQVVDIRKSRSAMQRSKAAVASEVPEASARKSEASTISTPPRMEPVTRTERQPAEPAPAAPTDTKSKTGSPSPERDVCRRPERVVARVDRPRPPSPRTAV